VSTLDLSVTQKRCCSCCRRLVALYKCYVHFPLYIVACLSVQDYITCSDFCRIKVAIIRSWFVDFYRSRGECVWLCHWWVADLLFSHACWQYCIDALVLDVCRLHVCAEHYFAFCLNALPRSLIYKTQPAHTGTVIYGRPLNLQLLPCLWNNIFII